MPAARLPSVDDYPLRWSRADAESILAALDRSGLTPAEFARRTGIQLQRLRRWRERLPVTHAPAPVRLVELVPRGSAPTALVEVLSPGGWRLQVPRELLGEVVRALSEGTC
jgi:transposase-like protein